MERLLNESQRGMVAAKLANMPNGGDKKSTEYHSANLQAGSVRRAEAAKMLNESASLAAGIA